MSVDLSYLLDGLERAPTEWIRDTLAQLDMIRRAAAIMRGEHWELVAVQDGAERVFDGLLVELGRRVSDAAACVP